MLLTSKPILILLRIAAVTVSAVGSRPTRKRVLRLVAAAPRLAIASIGGGQQNPACRGAEPNLEEDRRGLGAPLAESELERAWRPWARHPRHRGALSWLGF